MTLAPMPIAGGMGAAEPPTLLAVLVLMKPPGVADGARLWGGPPVALQWPEEEVDSRRVVLLTPLHPAAREHAPAVYPGRFPSACIAAAPLPR